MTDVVVPDTQCDRSVSISHTDQCTLRAAQKHVEAFADLLSPVPAARRATRLGCHHQC